MSKYTDIQREEAERIYAQRAAAPPIFSCGTDYESIESPVIEWPRYTCALGATQTVIAIRRGVPIVHSGPGCIQKIHGLIGKGEGYAGGSSVPCTNSGETEVVYGGEDRLREVIEGSFKVIDADLYVVLTGCTADIVGDDIGSVVNEYQLQDYPIVFLETGGFKSNNYISHEQVVLAIINQYVDKFYEEPRVEKGLVNVFASLPDQDYFWNGNLEEYKRILEGIGLKVNILFGEDSDGVEEWKTIPHAQFNILIGAWAGLEIVEHLEEKYNTPYLHFPWYPIGALDTSEFLNQVISFAGLSGKRLEKARQFIEKEERKYYFLIATMMTFLLEFRYALPRRFYVLHDASYTLGLTRFLLNEVGIKPAHQFVLDNTPPDYRDEIRQRFQEVSHLGVHKAEVSFFSDGGLAHDIIRQDEHPYRTLIIGSAWERQLAADIRADLIIASVPINYRLILGAAYVGYRGGIRLIEDLYWYVLDRFR
jgi:nitrogenase molybdenum-iron protein beta chain